MGPSNTCRPGLKAKYMVMDRSQVIEQRLHCFVRTNGPVTEQSDWLQYADLSSFVKIVYIFIGIVDLTKMTGPKSVGL